MKRLALPLILLLAIAAAVAAAWYVVDRNFSRSHTAPASTGGETTVDLRALPPFTKLAVDGLAEITLVQGTTESVSVEAPAKRGVAGARIDVRDGTLHIENDDSRGFWGFLFGGGGRAIRATITFRDLRDVKVGGAVKLRADGWKAEDLALAVAGAGSIRITGLDTDSLSVSGSGAMKAEIAGRVKEQRIAIAGAGDYRAANLASDSARVSVSGAGKVVVNAAKTLGISISGAGSVDYIGNPKVTQDISGAGRVRRRDAAQDAFPAIA